MKLCKALLCTLALGCEPATELYIDEAFDSEQTLEILDSVVEWNTRGNAGLSYYIGTPDPSCKTCVPVIRQDGMQVAIGRTGWTHRRHDETWIRLDTTNEACDLGSVALHELGHLVTGPEHSDNPSDVMSYECAGKAGWRLTEADLARPKDYMFAY